MDDLVRSVTCYNPRPLIFHGYIAPFLVLQAALYFSFLSMSPTDNISNATQVHPGNETHLPSSIDDAIAKRHSFEIWVIIGVVSVAAQIITFLFCHWSVDVKCLLCYTRSMDPHRSKLVKVIPTPNNGATELVPLKKETVSKQSKMCFIFQKTKYVYNEKTGNFATINFPCDEKISFYKEWKGYTNPDEMHIIDRLYGRNEMEMVIPEFKELFIERATAPFFVFQLFCVGLWCLDELVYYTLFTLFMLVSFEVILVKHQMRNMQEIRRMGNQPYTLQVYRQNKWKSIKSDQLLPGDLISVERSENSIPCDILLIRGSCIIDESTLTGESVPQMKEPIEDLDDDDRPFDINLDKLHILYGGTKVLQHSAPSKEQGCIGYVLKTGFNTSQGKLLRTILFGVKRVTANNFETFCFIMFLMVFAISSACYVWIKSVDDPKKSRYRLFFECTMIITSVIPPELPIELSLAVNNSLLSLSRLYIFCTEPFRIPFAGKTEYCCFDKTGTLTSNDLIVEGVAGLPEISDEESLVLETSRSTEKASAPAFASDKVKKNAKTLAEVVKSPFADHPKMTPIEMCPEHTQVALATCHSLTYLDEKLVGDPLESKVLEALNWNYSKSGIVVPNRGRMKSIRPIKLNQRFHFNSTLKRMSVISSYKLDLSNENVYICTAKGAPEFMKPLMKDVPDYYDQLYLEMSRLGGRVLALGYKTLGNLTHKELAELKREDVERDLMFAGFLIISCPLKADSREVCIELAQSGHRLMMITGDGALTACHVASVLNFVSREVLVLTKDESTPSWRWIATDQQTRIDFEDTLGESNISRFARKYDLCLTGDALSFVTGEQKPKFAYELIRRVKVFARVSPKQKELIITTLKSGGQTILMCGDGTNDVGALKHAHVGVALLSGPPKASASGPGVGQQQQAVAGQNQVARSQLTKHNLQGQPIPRRPLTAEERQRERMTEMQMRFNKIIEEQDGPQFVKLGDASIAAPFTSRLSSTKCISHIIKQGRCTLVTTLQMFKILALNALMSAYCQSVLYLEGIKFSDAQVLLQGILTTLCFLFITRSQPLKKLSSQRPLPNIFNLYTMFTVTLQFAIHFSSLIYLYEKSSAYQRELDLAANATMALESITATATTTTSTTTAAPADNSTSGDGLTGSLHVEFKPSLVNSTIFMIWMSVQTATFAINYKGHPFKQGLRNNRLLCNSFILAMFVIMSCVHNWSPQLKEQLSVVDFPDEFRWVVFGVIAADFGGSWAVDRICDLLFGRLELTEL